MMSRATLPISLWGYALETTAYILNLVPIKKVSKTPFEMWKGKHPFLGHIKIWGCEVYVRREAQDKLEARSEKCLYISYPEESFGYLFYKPKDDVVFVARRGVFLEREMISKEDSGSKIDLEEIQESADEEPIVNTNTQPEVVIPVKPDDISLPIRRTSGRMDVKTAFLNKKLIKDVFMAQPEDFENAKYPKRACKLQKAIYGLKQASRSWNLCFHEKITQFGFSKSEDESCIYVKVSGSVVVFLVLYADDILLIGNDTPTLQSVKDWLGKCFAMKDLRDASYILGIKIYIDRSKRLIGLSQDTYLDKILKRFKMENSKKGNLPLNHGINIRSILYVMTCTRPEVSFALSMIFLMNGGTVTWKSSKQDIVADSTCESKYIAACEASKEAIWIKNFIGDLGIVPSVQDPIEILCDNESAVSLTKEPKDHGKSKHIERKYHFV
ncbi:retrotransposon protein, putative, ty1-copia subclass [Tanacetum coccineum]